MPGKLNECADWFPRLASPGAVDGKKPKELSGITITKPSRRDQSWYHLPSPGRNPDLWGNSATATPSEVWRSAVGI